MFHTAFREEEIVVDQCEPKLVLRLWAMDNLKRSGGDRGRTAVVKVFCSVDKARSES